VLHVARAAAALVASVALPGCACGEVAERLGAAAARPEPKAARIQWRHSTALGSPSAGRLDNGVRLPAEGRAFFTWDPVKRRSPNRAWRRWGTDRLVRVVLSVARDFRAAHPRAPRMAVGDLSRPHGGDFGPRFGYIGHASHQNGLDLDVYYPRADGRERAPRDASEIDRALSQELVDRFLDAGARVIFVGPNTGLTGPAGVVVPLTNHDNHLHVRID
jgi:murein endopeptidase